MPDYNKTIHLPKTDFPMRAALAKREPDMLKEFRRKDVYSKLMRKNEGKPRFILHDGPPYANGDIHIGTALNKILKDIIIRHRNMSGYQAPYVPGWDTHGMPIETAIQKQGVRRNQMPVPEFRDKCRQFALKFLDRQRDEFMRLGGIGDWEHPYITLDPAFEARQVEVFGVMAEKGYIYQGLKPVYWCPVDETALAEAEVEYQDDACTSIYVKFAVKDDRGLLGQYCDLSKTYFVIWTTTPWTLPGNLAISLNAGYTYSLVEVPGGEVYIMAKDLVAGCLKKAGITEYRELATLRGSDFELMTAQHPFLDRESVIITGEHVTLEAGTGCVHTAPGFGAEDYVVCRDWDATGKTHIGIVVPVDSKGYQTEEAGKYAGLRYDESNAAILADLKASGALLASEELVHSYAHCWRCKQPIIYRATKQWFASVDAIKDAAVKSCDDIQWKPAWGKDRMTSMIQERSDWCISRQRTWGVPIPIFFCQDCGEPLVTPETIAAVAALFRAEGSNGWWAHTAEEILPAGTTCPKCGGKAFRQEQDIMDVWFDSGSTWAAVADARPELGYPADLYLEGGDQYRGWFQSSMLTSIAVNGVAPYRQIVTHGWTVDGEGKAMHKSLGNAVAPDEVIKQYGADMLRLWVSSADYTQDMRISKAILKQLSDAYLKIRNTARYILGNLDGFDPARDLVPVNQRRALDRWALDSLARLVEHCQEAYEHYDFHIVYRSIYNFCVVEMSNFYLDIIKDRLYCGDEAGRRSAQSTIYQILDSLVRLLAPILAFTSEEIWAAMPHTADCDPESVLLNDMPQPADDWKLSTEERWRWEQLLKLRSDVNKALEQSRAAKEVKKSTDAHLTLTFDEEGWKAFQDLKDMDLAELFIVSRVDVAQGTGAGLAGESFPGVTVAVAVSEDPKCPRCWLHHPDIGSDPEHPELCPRCAAVVRAMQVEL